MAYPSLLSSARWLVDDRLQVLAVRQQQRAHGFLRVRGREHLHQHHGKRSLGRAART